MTMPMLMPKGASLPKLEGGRRLEIVSDYVPAGDQPRAIEELLNGIGQGEREQVLLGVSARPWSLPPTRPWPPSSMAR